MSGNRLPASELEYLAGEAQDAYGTAQWAADILERQLAVVERRPRQYPDVVPGHVKELIAFLRGGAFRGGVDHHGYHRYDAEKPDERGCPGRSSKGERHD